MTLTYDNVAQGQKCYLTDILGGRVCVHGKKIGKLVDMIIVEHGDNPEVTKLVVHRPFGYPSLLIPWDRVKLLKKDEVVVSLEKVEDFEKQPNETDILLKDHILDKKVIDIEDREVEMVYDVKMLAKNGKLTVTDVNISFYRFLRRLGLKWFAKFVYTVRGKEKDHKIPWRFIQALPQNIGSFRGDVKLKVLRETLDEFHPADIADILEEVDPSQRLAIFNQLESEQASETLEEIEPSVQRDLVPALKKERVAQLLSTMTPGQAADILSALPHSETKEILRVLKGTNPDHAHKINSILGKQEERIGNYATSKILKLDESTGVTAARDYFNRVASDMAVVLYLYITDAHGRLVGVMDLKEFLHGAPEQTMKDIMRDNVVSLSPQSTLKEALELFSRYDFRAIPVVNEEGKLTGAIPYRDVMNLKHRFLE
ncbi:MAG: CBS domain-containing protein [Candidatus Peribacteraceae bacterium]|nr:CBS domain-containing protein [Candidatus Peribacteraceae bacterium]